MRFNNNNSSTAASGKSCAAGRLTAHHLPTYLVRVLSTFQRGAPSWRPPAPPPRQLRPPCASCPPPPRPRRRRSRAVGPVPGGSVCAEGKSALQRPVRSARWLRAVLASLRRFLSSSASSSFSFSTIRTCAPGWALRPPVAPPRGLGTPTLLQGAGAGSGARAGAAAARQSLHPSAQLLRGAALEEPVEAEQPAGRGSRFEIQIRRHRGAEVAGRARARWQSRHRGG